jgi:citrate lyase beta subunit
LLAKAETEFEQLGAKNREFARLYPGDRPARQPVHTVYGGAHLFKAETPNRLGELARQSLASYGRDPIVFAEGVGFLPVGSLSDLHADSLQGLSPEAWQALRKERPQAWLAGVVFERVQKKLTEQAVEDFRIDFEDGFGARPDQEEDETAVAAARETARGLKLGLLPPFIGIRVKSFGEEWKLRGARTLEIFVDTLLTGDGARLPDNFVVTLPKVTHTEQVRACVRLLDGLEQRHGLRPGTLGLELMVETTQALIGPDGVCPLPAFLQACEGRCVGAHLGTYDFTASCNITAAHQVMRHPWCDLAKGMMMLALAGTGVFLSDGATNVMPVGPHRGSDLTPAQLKENQRAVHGAWRLAHDNIRHSLIGGYYQGWDLHPAQLPVRYATCYSFFLEGLAQAADRLKNFVAKAAQATLSGEVFDDAATGQGLLNYFLRALNCGAIELSDVEETGLTQEEFALRSFAKILNARRARLG